MIISNKICFNQKSKRYTAYSFIVITIQERIPKKVLSKSYLTYHTNDAIHNNFHTNDHLPRIWKRSFSAVVPLNQGSINYCAMFHITPNDRIDHNFEKFLGFLCISLKFN